ncbi:alpha-ketoglutarate-dependent dioxygenase AlkB [Pedobacter sandarakinus]|uniref:alpha-ketoglutarate-dependent dioxygenase AlkB n=1 Tax=Pedobacter sandarakinus TaxID=353156 RepID=UPI002247B013|nr:alpha-ketoglutarate-dependent dioxygenase AlkB [Pedobacter sandarakinus]MCX2575084.1 alpha-ketoglutarate-dependent dioxygenase AlkB [Pedobacter sandarakinus]
METAVPGLFIYPDFISPERETQLLSEIDRQVWMVDYARRLQYYGFRNELEEPYQLIGIPLQIPKQILALSTEIVEGQLLAIQPDQVIINEYLPGEGIRPHKDRNYYENQICGVNLGSGCIMRFIRGKKLEIIDIEIPRRSLYVMQDDARKKWDHGIPPRKKDVISGEIHHRDRRVSITYRKVKPDKVHQMNPDGRVASILREKFQLNLTEG